MVLVSVPAAMFESLVDNISILPRLHGHIPPTYETGSTKKFRLGRTDTIRTASVAVAAFCEAMASKDKNVSWSMFYTCIHSYLVFGCERRTNGTVTSVNKL